MRFITNISENRLLIYENLEKLLGKKNIYITDKAYDSCGRTINSGYAIYSNIDSDIIFKNSEIQQKNLCFEKCVFNSEKDFELVDYISFSGKELKEIILKNLKNGNNFAKPKAQSLYKKFDNINDSLFYNLYMEVKDLGRINPENSESMFLWSNLNIDFEEYENDEMIIFEKNNYNLLGIVPDNNYKEILNDFEEFIVKDCPEYSNDIFKYKKLYSLFPNEASLDIIEDYLKKD